MLQRTRKNCARVKISWARCPSPYPALVIWSAHFRARQTRARARTLSLSSSFAPRAPAPAPLPPWTRRPAPRSPRCTAASPPPPPPKTLARRALAPPPPELRDRRPRARPVQKWKKREDLGDLHLMNVSNLFCVQMLYICALLERRARCIFVRCWSGARAAF